MPSQNWSRHLTAEPWRVGGFGLYIHWPFCQAKCPYCDFNSHVVKSIDQDRWARAYLSELDRVAADTSDRILGTVFFGGGTPSLMDPKIVDQIMNRIRANWSLANDFEATMEANPSSVEASRFQAYRAAGVDRVSLGIQALNDADLKALGRLHSADEAKAALDIAGSTFDRVSFDLIYARQSQSLSDWEVELTKALSYGTTHMSLYQLTIEDGTAFGERFKAGKLRDLPDDDLAADMFELTQTMMNDAGMPAYEVSNHAKPGQESRHNLIYWRGGDYLGIGPGAHGRITDNGTRYGTETPLAPSVWLTAVEDSGSGQSVKTPITPDEAETEYVMMSLRTSEGTDLARLSPALIESISFKINNLKDAGLIIQTDTHISVPAEKRVLLNAILKELLT
ncbi:radical SAM family heme chaperone HemW [uncultured Litoreibacter sp.]|uniref:radical SAM family heme chaperone HemW n=1 Tax=uncultured Litoreibacter sp. TaxID=1392394 RepID=UPI00261C455B|nr:radical SAM family heme chaperone HemW [uncultured Litoreibacter sp.]